MTNWINGQDYATDASGFQLYQNLANISAEQGVDCSMASAGKSCDSSGFVSTLMQQTNTAPATDAQSMSKLRALIMLVTMSTVHQWFIDMLEGLTQAVTSTDLLNRDWTSAFWDSTRNQSPTLDLNPLAAIWATMFGLAAVAGTPFHASQPGAGAGLAAYNVAVGAANAANQMR